MRDSAKCRRIVVETYARPNLLGRLVMTCCECPTIIDLQTDAKKWHADHVILYANGGEDTADNLRPICIECHAKKSANDTSTVAHGKRASDKHLGVTVKKGWNTWR